MDCFSQYRKCDLPNQLHTKKYRPNDANDYSQVGQCGILDQKQKLHQFI